MAETMRFHRPRSPEPEINLIPFIDILLVVLIFLMLSTTYSKFNELELTLPEANASAAPQRDREVVVAVTSSGRVLVNRQAVSGRDAQTISQALQQATQHLESPILIVSADAQASHQSVMLVLEAARRTGLQQIRFAARAPGKN